MMPDFKSLISPIAPEDFFQNYWEKSILHLSENSGAAFGNILTAQMLDDFLRKGDISPLSMRFVKDGADVESQNWTKRRTLINGKISETVANEKIFEYLADGTSVVINAAENSIPSLHRLCQHLEQEFKCRVQTNIYITPPNARGFPVHYDTHDVLILQIIGKKTWQIYDSPIKLQTVRTALPDSLTATKNLEINRGDLLYLPRGVIHSAATNDEISVHLTVSFYGRYGFDLIHILAELAEEDEFFRRAVPHRQSEKTAYLREFEEKLVEIIGKHDVESLIEKQNREFVETQKIEFSRRFQDFLQVEKLSLDSLVKRRENTEYIVVEYEDGLEIVFGREKIILPKIMNVPLQTCFQNEPFFVKELNGLLTAGGKVELVRRLINRGFLQIEKI